MPAHAKDFRTGAFLRANRLEPIRAVNEDRRDIAQCFDVVDNRRTAVQARDCRERRTAARLSQLTFDAVEQGSFFAANVRTCAQMHEDVAFPALAADVLAKP